MGNERRLVTFGAKCAWSSRSCWLAGAWFSPSAGLQRPPPTRRSFSTAAPLVDYGPVSRTAHVVGERSRDQQRLRLRLVHVAHHGRVPTPQEGPSPRTTKNSAPTSQAPVVIGTSDRDPAASYTRREPAGGEPRDRHLAPEHEASQGNGARKLPSASGLVPMDVASLEAGIVAGERPGAVRVEREVGLESGRDEAGGLAVVLVDSRQPIEDAAPQ